MVYLISFCYGFGLLLFLVFQYIHVGNNLFFLLNPVPFLVIIYAVFFSNTLSFAMAVLFSTIFSFAAPMVISDKLFLVSVLANILGVFSVSSRQSRRIDISRAGLLIGIASFLILLGLELIRVRDTGDINFASIYVQPLCSFFNGILCGVIALGSIPVLEVFFRITTSTRLLELLQPNQPLMQRLLKEAPGTYHHSMLVADLAEKAAESVQADSLLAKAAAFYHDVGKIKRPYFFVENQMGGVNYHDNLQPSLSSLIITSHTHDGVEIGKSYNLPKVILDVMVQHHGTDLVTFFHNKAKMNEKEDNLVQEETFRYDGVKPQTKEAGIIMICDAVEAASRTLLKPTPGSVELLVRRIVDHKDEDGQFDECNLTKRDLETVVVTIAKKLVSMFHNRIRYPDDFEQKTAAARMPSASPMASAPPVNGVSVSNGSENGQK
jgi:putative nucleotidyltransferase with HDIG domain